MGLYTELIYAIIPACFLTFCCSAIPTSPLFINVVCYLSALRDFEVAKTRWGCALLNVKCCCFTVVRKSAKFELARLKKEEEEKPVLATFWCGTLKTGFHDTGSLPGQENTPR